MEKKAALIGFKEIRLELETASYITEISQYRMDAMTLTGNLYGENNAHYRAFSSVFILSPEIQKKVLLAEIDSMIMEIEDEITPIQIVQLPKKISNSDQIINPQLKGKSKVFVVHGRDDSAKEIVARFLKDIGLEPIILHEQPNKGRTIIEKFEDHSSEVEYAIVLLTPDDIGGLESEPNNLSPRARQNVVFEMGHFFGRLGRKNVCALLYPGVVQPSDIDGIVYISLDQDNNWRDLLAKELKAAKLNISEYIKNSNSDGIAIKSHAERASLNIETKASAINSAREDQAAKSREIEKSLDIVSQMLDLISEMKKDLSNPENAFVREFVIKKKSTTFIWGGESGFEYYTEDHPQLQGKIHVLENLGYIANVAKGDQYPRWRMTEEFVKLILREG